MKIYVVYFRTMQDSPEVEIKCVTTSRELAYAKFHEAKEDEEAWNEDDGSGNWAEACIKTFDGISDEVGRSSLLYVTVETTWVEEVSTRLHLFGSEFWAKKHIGLRKKILVHEDPNLEPFDEDETFEESMHLHNPGVMSDYYFSVEPVIVQ